MCLLLSLLIHLVLTLNRNVVLLYSHVNFYDDAILVTIDQESLRLKNWGSSISVPS